MSKIEMIPTRIEGCGPESGQGQMLQSQFQSAETGAGPQTSPLLWVRPEGGLQSVDEMAYSEPSFTFMWEYWQEIRRYPDAVRGKVYDMLFRFAFDGVEPVAPEPGSSRDSVDAWSVLSRILPFVKDELEHPESMGCI